MPGAEAFFDTNVLLYLVSQDAEKARKAEALLEGGGIVSVQVLNEFANVTSRKSRYPWDAIAAALAGLRQALEVRPLTVEIHELGLHVAQRYGFSFYDSLLIAAALQAGCTTFWSEDLHDGQVIEGALTIRNPFA